MTGKMERDGRGKKAKTTDIQDIQDLPEHQEKHSIIMGLQCTSKISHPLTAQDLYST